MTTKNKFISKFFSSTLMLICCGFIPVVAHAGTIVMPVYNSPEAGSNSSYFQSLQIGNDVPQTNLKLTVSSPFHGFNTRTYAIPPTFLTSGPQFNGNLFANNPVTYQLSATSTSGQALATLSFVGHWTAAPGLSPGFQFVPDYNYMTLNQSNLDYSFCADAIGVDPLWGAGQLNVLFYNVTDYGVPTPKAPDGRLGMVSTTSTTEGPTCPQGAITVNLSLQNFAKLASALGITGDLYAAVDTGADYAAWGSGSDDVGSGAGPNIAPQNAGDYYYIPLTPNSWQQSSTQYQQAVLCVYPNAAEAADGTAQTISVAVAPKLSDLFTTTTTNGTTTYSGINPAGMTTNSCQITLSLKLSAQSPCGANGTNTFQSYTVTCPTPSGLVGWQNSVSEPQGPLPSAIVAKTVSPSSDPSSSYTAYYLNKITDFMCADDGASSGCLPPTATGS